MNINLSIKKTCFSLGLLFTSIASATINFDYEVDPLPLIKYNVLIPSSRLTQGEEENLAINILKEFFEDGTKTLDKQKLQDLLASFGANLEIQPGYSYLEMSITFPLNNGKVPTKLFDVAQENLSSPRVKQENFKKAKKLLRANMLANLDRDSSSLILGMQKLIAKGLFGLTPYTIDTFDRIKFSHVETILKNFYKNDDIWVGAIGPESVKADLQNLTQKMFPNSGKINDGMLKTRLESGYKPTQKKSLENTFLLIDKSDLTQIHYGFLRVSKKTQDKKLELIDRFTNYALIDSRLDSLWGTRIRGDRGIAYTVAGLMGSYYEYPVYSLYANPQRTKQVEAFEVLEKIMNDSFKTGDIFSTLKSSDWDERLMSYQNSERQSGATPEGRLDRRKDIVKGDMTIDLYNRPISKWEVSQKESRNRSLAFAADSTLIMGVIGDAKDLEPLIKKHFPAMKLLKISYKDVIKNNWIH